MTETAADDAVWTPNFIVDTPSSRDELSSHDRIAGSIIKVVLNNPTIKMIGILGGWGSGKSTIVQLVTGALENEVKPRIACFTFDAWQHQSDPPRRAFLEALAAFLETCGEFPELGGKDRDWRSKLDDLNRQKEELETTVTPTLTRPGRWFLASLFGWPVGMKLIGDGTLAAALQRDPAAVTVFAVGWFLVVLPVMIAAAIYLSWRPKFRWSWTWFTAHKPPYDKESILSVVANKHVESKLEVKYRSLEATSIEFRDSFWQMVKLAQTPDRRLVIVVDNLDRLPAEDAIKIWSTIRGLMLGSDASGQPVDRTGLPTVIMPIDEGAIGEIYSGGKENLPASRSFIEKTFDLVVHVPQPVLSRWHGYLKTRMAEVFGSRLKNTWQHKVGSVYEAYVGEKSKIPSPRELNAFVNSLALLALQRHGERFAIDVVAWFVLHRAEINDIHQTLAANKTLFSSSSSQLELAALHFGVKLEDAQELFMIEPLAAAIKARERGEFERLAAVPGFDRYFLNLLQKALNNELFFSPMVAAELLDSLNLEPESWQDDAWRRLRRLTVKYANEKTFELDELPGLRKLIALDGDPHSQGVFLRNMAARIATGGSSLSDYQKGEPFAALASTLINSAQALGLEGYHVTVPGTIGDFISLLQQELPDTVIRGLKPADDVSTKIAPYFSNEMGNTKSEVDVARALKAWTVQQQGQSTDWAVLINRLQMLLQNSVSEEVGRALLVTKTLYQLSPEARPVIDNWSSAGIFGTAFNTVWSQDDQVMALAAAFQMKYGHSTVFQDGRSWAERLAKEPELATWVDEALADLDVPADFNWLVARLKSHPAEAVLIQRLVMRRLDAGKVQLDDALQDPDTVNAAIPVDVQPAFWSRLSAVDGFWKRIEALNARQAAPIFRAVQQAGVHQARPRKALKAVFGATSPAEWLAAIESGQEPYSLAFELGLPTATSVNVGPSAYTALSESIGKMVLRDDHEYRLRWFEVSRKLSPSNQVVLRTRLATALMSGAVGSVRLRHLLSLAGFDLLEDLEFMRQADASVVHIVDPIAADHEGRQWLLERVHLIRPWVKKSKPAVRQSLGDRLRGPAESGEQVALALMKGLGLPI